MLTKLRGAVKPLAEAIGRALGKAGVSPNALTYAGLGLSILTPVAAYAVNLWLALTLLIASSFFDFLDGAVARAVGLKSRKGAFLDSFSDRIADAAYILTLKIAGVGWLPTFLFLTTSFLISYARARGEALNLKMEGIGVMERGDRLIAMAAALFAACIGLKYISEYIVWISIALCVVTVIHRFAYIISGAEE